VELDIHMSLHHNTITNYNQQDATLLEFISTYVLHVSGGFSAHHQEQLSCYLFHGSS
jgi:hypothetical protein